jgi:hypothetical protein
MIECMHVALAGLGLLGCAGGEPLGGAGYGTARAPIVEGDELLGVYDGVAFTVSEGAATLTLVNGASEAVLDDDVPLDRRAVDSILEARPVATVLALSQLYWVGTSALTKLRAYALASMAGGAGDDCAAPADCAAGLSCVGVPFDGSPEIGKCADTAAVIPGDGDDCSAAEPCGGGLTCAGTTIYGGAGYCRPLWMLGAFASAEDVPIPDGSPGGIMSSVVVYGLASVPEDIVVTLDIAHPRPEDLVVTLHAPNTSSDVLWENEASPAAEVIAGWGIDRDDFVNGTWSLQVADTVAGEPGTLHGFTLTVSSRYD